MHRYGDVPEKGHDLENRDVRALTEYLTVIPRGGAVYEIVSESGRSYRVDAREGRCTCPDYRNNLGDDEMCKHSRRVRFETGERALPDWIDPGALPDDFAAHVDATPVVAATDGGVALEAGADGDGETDGDGDDDDDGETCLCDRHDLGCFEHFRVDEQTDS